MSRRYALILLLFCSFTLSACAQYTFRGMAIEPSKPAPDFTLTDQFGQPFTLSAQKGSVVLMFFGFTACPDVCPTTLADIAAAKQQLGSNGEKIKVVLISVDPERDTPANLADYVDNYDPSFVGLTGTAEQLAAVWKSYGVTANRRELPNSKLGYTIDHSAYIYMIDKAGNWRAILPFGVTDEDIASDAGHLVNT